MRTSLHFLTLGLVWLSGATASQWAHAAEAEGDTPTPVLSHAVPRGQALVEADFETLALSAGAARGALTVRQAVGQEARRNLRAGAPVRSGDLVPARLIHRGESVTIEVVSGALQISSAGRALDDAARGENVRVLNLATNRTIEGTAEAAGRIAIRIP
ncbi:flagellar basal body P-ring formation protein FlgA [Novosphingobium profundi]|nr:flagellar basal body P-ring formation protein FlgA [Novosphingobium profundi]